MTLTLELSTETELWLETEAAKQGVDPSEYARRLIEHSRPGQLWQSLRKEERCSRLQNIRGKYKNVGFTTEDLHRERQIDLAREEQQLQKHSGEPGQ